MQGKKCSGAARTEVKGKNFQRLTGTTQDTVVKELLIRKNLMREGGGGGLTARNGQSDYLDSAHGRSSLWLWYLSLHLV